MFHDEENLFDGRPLLAPPLPRAEHERLFIFYDGFEHLRYPGGELFAKLEDSPRAAGFDDYVEIRNPLDRVAKLPIFVGPSNNFQVRCERKLIPEEFRCSEARMLKILGQSRPLRTGYLRVYLELAPGETAKVPPHWLPALRSVKDGVVMGGYFPQLEVIGETVPPRIHDALTDTSRAPVRQGARRRS